MVFLIPIPVSLLLALVWCSWTARPRRPAPPVQSVEAYRRTMAALAPARERRAMAALAPARERRAS